ncbi:hypothetical protein ADUPG1_008209, partial [Aduncisulcus paluster]
MIRSASTIQRISPPFAASSENFLDYPDWLNNSYKSSSVNIGTKSDEEDVGIGSEEISLDIFVCFFGASIPCDESCLSNEFMLAVEPSLYITESIYTTSGYLGVFAIRFDRYFQSSFNVSDDLLVITAPQILYINDIYSNSNFAFRMMRLTTISLCGGSTIYDISPFYRAWAAEDMDFNIGTTVCRSESDSALLSFLASCFLSHSDATEPQLDTSACSLNGSEDYCVDDDCPSIIANEVYNDDGSSKECAYFALSSGGLCYTIHDSNLRAYLTDTHGISLVNGIIPVSSLRTYEHDPVFPIDISGVSGISTLQGLEYIGLTTSLILDGYDLSLNQVDRDVVRILTMQKTYDESTYYGVTSLSVSDTGISKLVDVFACEFSYDVIAVSTLDISENSISDISYLLDSSKFPDLNLTSGVTLTNNNVCGDFSSEIGTFSSEEQTCHCEDIYDEDETYSFYDEKTACNEIFTDYWSIECWAGYYYDEATSSCVLPTSDSEIARINVCSRHSSTKPVLINDGRTKISCECRDRWYGDDCDEVCPFGFLDDVCSGSNGTCDETNHVCICAEGYGGDACEYVGFTDTTLEAAVCSAVECESGQKVLPSEILNLTTLDVSTSDVTNCDGLILATNLTNLNLSSTQITVNDALLTNIPKTVTELIMNNVSVPAGKSFSDFTVLTTLSLQSDSTFDSSASTPFPSSLTSLNLSDTTGFTDMSKIPTDVVTLVVDGISLANKSSLSALTELESFSANNTGFTDADTFHIYKLENLTTLSLQSNDLTDISLLFNLKATLTSLDVSSNKIWLTDGDALSYPTAITLAYSDQDPAAHTSCEYSEDSS